MPFRTRKILKVLIKQNGQLERVAKALLSYDSFKLAIPALLIFFSTLIIIKPIELFVNKSDRHFNIALKSGIFKLVL